MIERDEDKLQIMWRGTWESMLAERGIDPGVQDRYVVDFLKVVDILAAGDCCLRALPGSVVLDEFSREMLRREQLRDMADVLAEWLGTT